MNWDAVIAVTELLGLVAIVASLIYVGKQLKQNADLARASIVHETSVSWANASALLASDAELADIYLRGINGDELTAVEKTRLEALIDIYMNNLEDIDHQYKADLYFDEEDALDIVDYLAPLHKDLMMSPVGRNWWTTLAETIHTPSFYAKMDRIIKRWEQEE